MIKLNRIFYDGVSWNLSEYFDYIREVADQMPPSLRDFAINIESYSLHGCATLHDARILSLLVSKVYGSNFSDGKTLVDLRLVDQLFEGEIALSYGDVSRFEFNESGLAENGHADILLHEFSVIRPGVYSHQIVLEHGGGLFVEFSDFSRKWVRFDS